MRRSLGKGLSLGLATVGFVLASASARAIYFVNHSLTNFTQSSVVTNMVMYDTDDVVNTFATFESMSMTYAAGAADTIINTGPYLEFTTHTTFVGIIGGAVAVGMKDNSAAGEDFFSVFGVLESTIYTAILDLTTGSNIASGNATLNAFFNSMRLSGKLTAVGSTTGKVMAFSNGAPIGNYSAVVSDAPASVPEPFTMLLGGAAAGLGFVRQRRRRAA